MQFINYILGGSSGITVQSDEIIMTAGMSTIQDTMSAVTKSKSFLLFTYKCQNPNQGPIQNFVRGKILNGTTVEFKINGTAPGNIEIRWFVCTFPAWSPANVQHSGDVAMSSTPFNQTITAVNVAHAFPIVSFGNNDTAWDNSQPVMAQLTSSTNLQLTAGSAVSTIVNWQVIECPSWDVSVYTDYMAAGDTTENTPIATINPFDTFMIVSGRNPGSTFTLGNSYPKHFFNSRTQIQAFRVATGPDFDFTYHVICTNNECNVMNWAGEQISGGTNSKLTTISPINTAKSALLQNNMMRSVCLNLTDAQIDGDDVYVLHEIISSTSINHRRWGSPGLTIDFAFTVLEFT